MRGNEKLVGVLFRDRASAERAIVALSAEGVRAEDVSLVGPTGLLDPPATEGGGDRHTAVSSEHPHIDDMAVGSLAGGAVGFIGGMGLLLSGALALPAIGLAIAGPLVGALTVAGLNRHAKTITHALKDAGVPEQEAHHLESEVKAGNILVAIAVPPDQVERAREVMSRLGGQPAWQDAAARV